MKKNRMMRLASVLLVAVLMTTCTISGTFAKYVTTVDSKDEARVAQWGFGTATLDIQNLFEKAYEEGDVSAATDVIAPGTEGQETFQFVYNGVGTGPEVKYTLDVDATTGSSCADDIKANKNIQWKLDSNAWGDWNALIAAIEALEGAGTFGPGEKPDVVSTEHTVYWQWLFEGGTAEYEVVGQSGSGTGGKLTQNEYDTYMGNKGTLDKVTLKIIITATQIGD